MDRNDNRKQTLSAAAAVACTALLTVSYSTNAMDRIIFPMLLKWISADYGFELSAGGFLATVFALGAGLASWPTGALLDRWPRRMVAAVGMVIYSVFTAATVVAHGFIDMAIFRFLTGVGEAMQLAALFTIACSYYPRNKALLIGIINLGFGMGNFLGPMAAISLMGPDANWHLPFLVFSALGVVFAACILIFVPRSYSEAGRTVGGPKVSGSRFFNADFFNRNVICGGISATCWGFCTFSHVGLYATFLINDLGYSPAAASFAVSLFGIGGLFGFFGGWIGDRYSNVQLAICAWLILMACWVPQYTLVTNEGLQLALNFVAGFAVTSMLHPNNVALLQRSVRPEFTGQATGFFHACAYIAAGFAGLGFGYLVQLFGWDKAAVIIFVTLPVISIAALALIKNETLQGKGKSEPENLQEQSDGVRAL